MAGLFITIQTNQTALTSRGYQQLATLAQLSISIPKQA
jgi:hypothetical protein